MDIRELRYFVQAAKDCDYSAAAKKLAISQPALSKVIKKMENELGCELFYPFQRKQRLTDAGKALLKESLRIISEYDQIVESSRIEKSIYQGQVSIGIPPLSGTCFFCDLISSFSKQYPGIRLFIKEIGATRILKEVEEGLLDIGCAILPVSEKKFDWVLFCPDSICLVVSKRHPLAAKRRVTLQELKGESFLLLSSDFDIHQEIRSACREVGFDPEIALVSGCWDLIIQMVRLDRGIAFLARSLFHRFSFPDISTLEIDHPLQKEDLALITKKGSYVSYSANCFIAHSLKKIRENPYFLSYLPPVL